MNAREYMKRLIYLEECIRKGKVRSVECIQRKFGCCDKTARSLIPELRVEGLDVRYSKALRKYHIVE